MAWAKALYISLPPVQSVRPPPHPSIAWPADLAGRRIGLLSHLLSSPSPHLTTHHVPTWALIFNPSVSSTPLFW
ncbi:hypothetical protein EDC04DRAFT_2746242 [Pisolithus marmoratus]|nr:hypothetical protein EDC04DRAFT_2746242 [Pisolithus marmoratus]